MKMFSLYQVVMELVCDAAVDSSLNLNTTYPQNLPVLEAIFNKLPLEGFYSLDNCKAAVSEYFEQNLSGIKN